MTDAYVGEIRLFPFNYAPKNWALCNGQIISIQQNTPLFAIIGTYYGGNGTTTFALPNLQGRVLIGQGQRPGGSDYVLGEVAGVTSVTLSTTEMPAHNHALNANTGAGTVLAAAGNELSAPSTGGRRPVAGAAYNSADPNVTLSPLTLGLAGSSQPHNNMQPYLTMSYCICQYGIFPSRN